MAHLEVGDTNRVSTSQANYLRQLTLEHGVEETASPVAKSSRTPFLFGAVILALYLMLSLGDAYSSAPWCDEAWLSNPALTFLRTGHFGTPILTPFAWGPPLNLPHIEQRTYWIMPLQMIAETGWFRVFGFSLIALRCLSILWGGIAIAALGAVTKKLTGDTAAAMLAMLLMATDYFFLTRAMDGRMDMMAAALMLCGFAAYLHLRETSLVRGVALAGLLAAGSAFTHPVGGFFSLAGLGLLGFWFDRRRFRFVHALLFALPFLVIGACWGAYAIQDLPAFRAQLAGNAYGRWEGISSPYWSVYRELRYKYFQAYGLNSFNGLSLQHLRLLALAVYVISLIAVAVIPALRKQAGAKPLLALALVFVFAGGAFDGAKRWYYLVYVLPALVALVAVCVRWLWQSGAVPRVAVGVAVSALLVMQVGGTLYRVRKNDYKNLFLPAANFAMAHDADHKLILGGGELGFVSDFPPYLIDDITLGYFSGRRAELIFVPEVYWGIWMSDLNQRAPAVGRFISETLRNDYALSFQNARYRIYERKR